MALKALDQRMAGSAPNAPQNGNASLSQSPRTSAAAVPPTVPIPTPASATDGTDDEADIGDTKAKTKE